MYYILKQTYTTKKNDKKACKNFIFLTSLSLTNTNYIIDIIIDHNRFQLALS